MGFIDEVPPERRDELLDKVAEKIAQYGLITPAILFLEGHRPFSFIASQGVHFFAPFGDTFMGAPYMSELAFLMQDRENITLLVERLEALARQRNEEKQAQNPGDDEQEHEEE
jgi:hypothetical protein